jgi:methylene-tetrahydromethanopterin dehydrogenase
MARSILYLLSPLKHMSPFDVNMAVDAGFDVVLPYTGVQAGEVATLVQDAIFSRAPQDAARTCFFVGGKDAEWALDALALAKAAFVPPFQLHLFADPAGSFTTAAAMVALVARALQDRFGAGLAGRRVAILGGTGVVAFGAAVLVAQAGARPVLVGHDGRERVARIAAAIAGRFSVQVEAADGSDVGGRRAAIADAEVILAAARAGIQVLDDEDLHHAPKLLVAADVNAVPPAGIAGLDLHSKATPFGASGTVGIGALAIGNVKYGTESGLFRRILAADKPLVLDFQDAFALASGIVARA